MDTPKDYADKFAILALEENEECWMEMILFLKRHKKGLRRRSILSFYWDIDSAAKKVLLSFGQDKEDALRELKEKMSPESVMEVDCTIEEQDDV